MFAVRVKQKLLILVKNKKKEMNEQAFRGPSVSSEVGSRCLVPHCAAQETRTRWGGEIVGPMPGARTCVVSTVHSSHNLKLKNWPTKA